MTQEVKQMRTNKDKTGIPKRYYRPKIRRCPHCQWKLKRWHKLWHKYLNTLSGRYYVISQGYRCSNPDCTEAQTTYRSIEAEMLSVPESSYGIDVIVEVGYQRFWQHRTVPEIQASLRERVAISERQILNLLANFLALLRAGQAAKIAELGSQWQALDGLVLAIDGMQPEKGSPALYVVREAQLGVTLRAEKLETGDQQTIATQLLEPIKGWGIPVKGVVSDAQESIRLAVAQVYPDKPHQNCQFHCLKEAGRPSYERDQALKTELKKLLRGRLNRAKQAVQRLPENNPYRPVLLKYVRLLRFTLLIKGLPPFDLGGLRLVEQLTTLAASLQRAREKGGIVSWIACSRLPIYTSFTLNKRLI
jgi:hypothetical protein